MSASVARIHVENVLLLLLCLYIHIPCHKLLFTSINNLKRQRWSFTSTREEADQEKDENKNQLKFAWYTRKSTDYSHKLTPWENIQLIGVFVGVFVVSRIIISITVNTQRNACADSPSYENYFVTDDRSQI